MITPEVLEFIKNRDAKGLPRDATRAMLMSLGGWTQDNIDEAFAAVPTIYAAPTAKTPNPPKPIVINTGHSTHPLKHQGLIVTVALLLVLLGAAGAAYAFVPVVKHQVHFLTATPNEKVALSLMLLNTVPERYSVTVTTETYNEEGEEPFEGTTATLLRGRSALQSTSVIERSESVGGVLPARVHSSFTVSSAGVAKPLSVDGEMYADNDSLLIKLDDTLDLLFFSTGPVRGKWISLIEETENVKAPVGGALAESVMEGYDQYRSTLEYVLTRAPEYIRAKETNDVRTIHGERARRFTVWMDGEAFSQVMLASPLATSETLSEDAKEALTAAVTEAATALQDDPPTELWISERTRYPVKWRGRSVEALELSGTSYTKVTETTGRVSIDGEFEPIIPPEPNLSIGEAFKAMLGS